LPRTKGRLRTNANVAKPSETTILPCKLASVGRAACADRPQPQHSACKGISVNTFGVNSWSRNRERTFDEGGKQRSGLLHLAFIVAVAVKGIDGLIEGLAGLAIAILGTRGIYDLR